MTIVRLVLVSVSVLFALAALGLARDATGTAVAHHPRLALTRAEPLIVSGRHFRAHERVSLVLHQPSGATRRRARAGTRGAFRKVFTGVTVDRCSGFGVSAKGSAGSRATFVRRALPECPPA
jgi:hypothetical protein